MTWATTADVLSVTGASATALQLAQGEAVIEIYANRTPSASARMGQRDLHWMKSATCWQTVWQAQQYGFNQRNNADSVMQDGMQVQRNGIEHYTTLAPLAARALKNLSWIGSRTLRTPNVRIPTGAELDFTLEESDPYSQWERL